MISNVNIQQNFNVVDHSIDNVNQDPKSVYGNYNSQSVSDSINAPTTTEMNVIHHVTGDNGFSIYERSIDFHTNFRDDRSEATTKDTATLLVTSQMEPNLLLKNLNNNHVTSPAAAAREVESVHNYSKNLYSTNIKSYNSLVENNSLRRFEDDDYVEEDEEDDEDDDYEDNIVDGKDKISQNDNIPLASSKDKNEEEEKTTPDHHARRPMNAFLIFCKRHRAIVREKYPNLENRSITKILGDWWANLDQEEKICYTNLAKQYKDAFFSANPNFKWYKLPAPPLRTLSTRPGNADRPLFHISTYGYDADSFTNESTHRTNGSGHIKENLTSMRNKVSRGPNVGIFKLADETQMGGLNSLMASYDGKSLPGNNNLGEHEDELDPDNSFNVSKIKLTPTNRTEPFSNMRCHAAKMQSQIDNQTHSHVSDSINHVAVSNETKMKDISSPVVEFEEFVVSNSQLTTPEKNIFFEDDNLKKSARACKGKRYLEFMSSGKIIPSSKKVKVNQPNSPTLKIGYDRDFLQYSAMDHLYASQERSGKNDGRKCDGVDSGSALETVDSKLFDASDFDLEEKIRALPALSLDKYLSRKRETKKKKKINAKRLVHTKSPQTIGEAKERIRNSMVGSQKRKARKESITRRDITHENVETVGLFDLVESPLIDEKITSPMTTENASDLFFLATIAEVAAGAVNSCTKINTSIEQEN